MTVILPVASNVHIQYRRNINFMSNEDHVGHNVSSASVNYPSIFKFSKVDETLYRGGRPKPEQMVELKNFGIDTIIDLSTENFQKEGYSEQTAAEELGINYVKIPIVSNENPSENDLNVFFGEIDKIKNKRHKLFIHCLEGKDRTGLFVELYKIKFGLSDAEKSINYLIRNRYNFSENPLAMTFIRDFAAKIKTKV